MRAELLLPPPLSSPSRLPFFFLSFQTSYIFMRVLCVDPSVRMSVSPSIRACGGARACERASERACLASDTHTRTPIVSPFACRCGAYIPPMEAVWALYPVTRVPAHLYQPSSRSVNIWELIWRSLPRYRLIIVSRQRLSRSRRSGGR